MKVLEVTGAGPETERSRPGQGEVSVIGDGGPKRFCGQAFF